MNSIPIEIKHQNDFQIAPCLKDSGYSSSGQALVKASRELGNNRLASTLRAWCVPFLFNNLEELLKAEKDPVEGINSLLNSLADFLSNAENTGLSVISGTDRLQKKEEEEIEVKDITGDHYGKLFESFSDRSYWDEPVELLKQRLERNDIEIGDIKNKKTLDVGCGGGRYSVAWCLLGASPVTGVDISPINVAGANRRIQDAKIDSIDFKEGNVLDLEFEDEVFDVVFSNGVLHHTTDWITGVNELVRVMKPGGLGWLYLIENPGGVFWDMIEILRLVMKDEEKSDARKALRLLDIPANRIFYMLDHVMVPINLRLTCADIEECLSNAGASNIRRLTRGSDFDRVEHIYQNNKYAEAYFGIGEHRYVFSK